MFIEFYNENTESMLYVTQKNLLRKENVTSQISESNKDFESRLGTTGEVYLNKDYLKEGN